MKTVSFATLIITLIAMAVVLPLAVANTPQKGSITGEVYVRERANGDDSLLFAINSGGANIDKVRFKFVKVDRVFSEGLLPKGWTFKYDGKLMTFEGPPRASNIFIRLDTPSNRTSLATVLANKKCELEALSGRKTVFKQDVSVTSVPKVNPVPLNLLFNFPPTVSRNEVFTAVESFYAGDDWKFARNFQLSFGIRWDYQQSYSDGGATYLKFNNFDDNAAPRFGFIWDFTGKGRGKIYANYAQFLEAPVLLDKNVQPRNLPKSENLPPGYLPLSDFFTDLFGEKWLDETVTKTVFVPLPAASCTPAMTGGSKFAFAGKTMCFSGCVPNMTYWGRLTLDGKQDLKIVGASRSSATVLAPEDAMPGVHTISFPGVPGEAKVTILKLEGTIDKNKLFTGEPTTMRLKIVGTEESLPLEITNTTPTVIDLQGGVTQSVNTSGGPDNSLTRMVRGIKQGNFKIDYKLSRPCLQQ